MGPRELSTCLSALATLLHRPSEEWLQTLLRAAESQLPQFSPRDLSTFVWALGTLSQEASEGSSVLHSDTEASCSQILPFSSHILSLFLKAVEVACLGCFRRFNPQDLSTLSVGLARLRHLPSEVWIKGFLGQTMAVLPQCGTQVRT